MDRVRSVAVLRLAAFAIDWFVIALWGGLLFGVVMLTSGGDPPRPPGPWSAQALSFVAMTLPFALYLSLCESSRWRGTLGKRAVGLEVLQVSNERLTLGRAFLRNGLKLVPWECGHLVAQQSIYSGDDGVPIWLAGVAALSIVVPLGWVGALFVHGAAPYDRWSGVRVTRRMPA